LQINVTSAVWERLRAKPVVEVGDLLEQSSRTHEVAGVDQKIPLGHGDFAVQTVRIAETNNALDCRLKRRPILRRRATPPPTVPFMLTVPFGNRVPGSCLWLFALAAQSV